MSVFESRFKVFFYLILLSALNISLVVEISPSKDLFAMIDHRTVILFRTIIVLYMTNVQPPSLDEASGIRTDPITTILGLLRHLLFRAVEPSQETAIDQTPSLPRHPAPRIAVSLPLDAIQVLTDL